MHICIDAANRVGVWYVAGALRMRVGPRYRQEAQGRRALWLREFKCGCQTCATRRSGIGVCIAIANVQHGRLRQQSIQADVRQWQEGGGRLLQRRPCLLPPRAPLGSCPCSQNLRSIEARRCWAQKQPRPRPCESSSRTRTPNIAAPAAAGMALP